MINDYRTFPLSVGKLPFITVGEFGANLPYLGHTMRSVLLRAVSNSLECVEIGKGVSDCVRVNEFLQIIHQFRFGEYL